MTLQGVEESAVVECACGDEVDGRSSTLRVCLFNSTLDNWVDDEVGFGDFNILL